MPAQVTFQCLTRHHCAALFFHLAPISPAAFRDGVSHEPDWWVSEASHEEAFGHSTPRHSPRLASDYYLQSQSSSLLCDSSTMIVMYSP